MVFVVFVIAFFAFAAVDDTRYLPRPDGDLVSLAAVAAFLVILTLSSRAERRFAPWRRWRVPVRLLLAAAVLAAQVLLLLGISTPDHRRCVDTRTMTVLPDQVCAQPWKQPVYREPVTFVVPMLVGPGSAQWYVGGTGLQPGAPVRGGSLVPSATTSGSGGGNDDGTSGSSGGGDNRNSGSGGGGDDGKSGGSGGSSGEEDGGYGGGYEEEPPGGYGGGAGEEPGGGAGEGGEGFGGGGGEGE
jgi:hypothetical protein